MTMDVIAEDERFAAMLLSRVGYYHLQEIRTLYTMVGSAQAVVAASDDISPLGPPSASCRRTGVCGGGGCEGPYPLRQWLPAASVGMC